LSITITFDRRALRPLETGNDNTGKSCMKVNNKRHNFQFEMKRDIKWNIPWLEYTFVLRFYPLYMCYTETHLNVFVIYHKPVVS